MTDRGHGWTFSLGVSLLAIAAFVLGACGGDTADEEPATSADTETPATQPPTEPTPAETVPSEDDTPTIDPPLELTGSTWVITNYSYNPSNTGITNTLGEEPFFELGEDGTVTGHTGCNEFEGNWETTGPYYDYDEAAEAFEDKIDGQPVTISAELTTSVECDGFVGEQDVDLLSSLIGAEIWYVGNAFGDEAGGITLHSDNGDIFADPA